ncbi:uncharacterized protein J4E88_010945 [Alternaria novae-zelandiae]|uniref:uncharacterized protein n=1 Tax=Alternaria novae-zelandiae TaxID=430562 RepID=UPI0020C58084|nr:uncharacterized protein J4E88_010945 [Alternaria novae-zelandiae]KAI4661497.1 hypothetical protein J4E88_010945 [Alternaria novae-zelandiae]
MTSLATGRTLRLLFAFIGIAIGVEFLVLFDWAYIESLPSDILGKQAFHPKPFVILKTGSADDKSRTDAQLSTVIKCISNVLIVSDGNHTYGRDHRTIDVLADLPPNTYLTPEDYVVYETQKNASRQGTKLQQGHEGWRIDKYKFLPEVEKAIDHNKAAEWYVFLESDTYIFWDNVFRLLEDYITSLP